MKTAIALAFLFSFSQYVLAEIPPCKDSSKQRINFRNPKDPSNYYYVGQIVDQYGFDNSGNFQITINSIHADGIGKEVVTSVDRSHCFASIVDEWRKTQPAKLIALADLIIANFDHLRCDRSFSYEAFKAEEARLLGITHPGTVDLCPGTTES